MKKSHLGFTLLELMFAVAIAAVLLMIAAPTFTDTIQKSRVEAAQGDLIRDITFARQEALSRNSLVSVCRSANGTSCAGAGDWNQGWIVFVETVSGTAGTVDTGEEVIRIHKAVNTSDDLEGTSAFIQFAADGMLQLPAAGTPIFTACSPGNNHVRGVLLLRSGRTVGSRSASGVDYVQVSAGSPVALSCS